MGLILQRNSDARAVWHHKHPVSWIIALESTSCVRALFKSGLARLANTRRCAQRLSKGKSPFEKGHGTQGVAQRRPWWAQEVVAVQPFQTGSKCQAAGKVLKIRILRAAGGG